LKAELYVSKKLLLFDIPCSTFDIRNEKSRNSGLKLFALKAKRLNVVNGSIKKD